MEKHPHISELRSTLESVLVLLAHIESRLDDIERIEARPPLPSYEEEIAAATSTTAIFKVVEHRLGPGNDRRTLLKKLERLVRVYRLDRKYSDWSTDVELARYVAQLEPDGRPKLIAAIERLNSESAA